MSDDFWDNLLAGYTATTVPSAVDQRIGSKGFGESFESVRHLTDRGRAAAALTLPVTAGTRVVFAGTLGALLTYPDPPFRKAEGVVVKVRSANGDVTAHDGKVFVKWDDGQFRPIHAEHLRRIQSKKKARVILGDPTAVSGRIPAHITQIRVAGLGDLSSFLKVAEGTLVHKSTNDLWSFNKGADGLVVERLFNSNGEPLKG